MTFFFLLGAVGATDLNDVSNTEDSNLNGDVSALPVQNKLEVSSEDSISETNIVNSHDDNLNNYPAENSLLASESSDYEDNVGLQASNASVERNTDALSSSSSSNGDVVAASSSNSNPIAASSTNNVLSASSSKVSTKLTVSDTHYDKSATYFKVTLKDSNGKAVKNQKVVIKINNKKYSANSNNGGIATFKTAALKVGSYTMAIAYSGNSNYSASSLSKKVKVLSSVRGSDMTKYYGVSSKYKATFWKDTDVLANTKISFKVNGKTYTRTTDKNGVASLKITLAPGKYVISTTNPYSGEKLSNNIVVKKDSTTLSHGSTKTYVLPNYKYAFSVTLKSKHNVLIKNAKVKFTCDDKKVTAKTNSNGQATIYLKGLAKGTHKISYSYKGSSRYSGASESGKVYVQKSKVSFQSNNLNMVYKDGSKFAVKLLDSSNKAASNKNVKVTIDGKTYTSKTNKNGWAYFKVGDLKPGTYTARYQFSKLGSKYYNFGTKNIVVAKQTASIVAKDLVMSYNDGSVYKAAVKDKSGNLLKDTKVKFTVNGKSYTKITDSNGIAKLKITLPVGYYTINSVVSDSCYKSSTVSKHVLVDGTKFIAEDKHVSASSKVSYSVKVSDAKSKPIKNVKISFKLDGKSLTGKTNSNGVATVNLGVLSKGSHKITYSYESASGSSKIYVVDKITIKQIVASSKTVKNYIEKNNKLPATVKIGDCSYSTAEYLYFASKAIINLKSGSTASIDVKDVSDPTKPGAAADKDNLVDYLAVAKSVVKTADSTGTMPNSVNSDVGTIGYNGLVYAFARINVFYGENNRLPSHVSIESYSSSSSTTSSGLNDKNTIENLAAYLAASANCQVNDAKIKALVTKLTSGVTSDKEKANAIYTYVRDTVSYSFYYDTKYGAVGTLNAKTGNCVDHTHLLVAMYRTAGLAARYVHGTCTFSSGSTYGHVWCQVLIGNTWTVSDATSSRNSLGSVANWNTNTFKLKSISSSISF